MLKWKVLAFLGFIFGVAGVVWGYAQQKKAIGFFELRVYTAQPGKRDALAARFAGRTAAIYARHGITNVGCWIRQQSDAELRISAENTFIYMRAYPSKEERDKRLKAAHDDPEFGEVVTKQEQNPATRLTSPRAWAFGLVGIHGGCTGNLDVEESRANFDQQPIEAQAMVSACLEPVSVASSHWGDGLRSQPAVTAASWAFHPQ